MVRKIYTLSALLIACISAVSALPAPGRHAAAETSCVVARLGANGVSPCSLPAHSKPVTSDAHVLEGRAAKKTPEKKKAQRKKAVAKKKAAGVKVPTNRKARAKARVAKGQPKATAKDKGRTPGVPRVKPKPPMSAKKQNRVAEKKENRNLAKKQKHANKIAEAKQKQKMPPYGMDEHGKLRKPEQSEVAKGAWTKHTKAQTDKAGRKAAWHAMSPADQAKKEAASKAKQGAKAAADKAGNVKDKNRQNRVNSKAKTNAQRKAENQKHAAAARTQYNNAQGLPSRHDKFTSPQGKPYTGKDVRQGVYASEHAQAKGGVGYNAHTGKPAATKQKLPKEFENRPNSDGTHPLPGVAPGNLKEYPIVHDKQHGHDGRKPTPSDARIITTKNSAGHTVLAGKVGHAAGSDDHHHF
ncbi:hypothetical protein CPC08DRAFT_759264 [Agrocybe pediades]|nr:hypothetical protein CPC08DRAFT_759264 [Agrocybe pediades]